MFAGTLWHRGGSNRSAAPRLPDKVPPLLAAAIRDPDPVIVCEHKALFADKGEVPDGEHVVEQQAYYRTEAGRIKWLRIMCSGAMPLDPEAIE